MSLTQPYFRFFVIPLPPTHENENRGQSLGFREKEKVDLTAIWCFSFWSLLK
jgi:hypothetical protein